MSFFKKIYIIVEYHAIVFQEYLPFFFLNYIIFINFYLKLYIYIFFLSIVNT